MDLTFKELERPKKSMDLTSKEHERLKKRMDLMSKEHERPKKSMDLTSMGHERPKKHGPYVQGERPKNSIVQRLVPKLKHTLTYDQHVNFEIMVILFRV